jgi:hypothetical protein
MREMQNSLKQEVTMIEEVIDNNLDHCEMCGEFFKTDTLVEGLCGSCTPNHEEE